MNNLGGGGSQSEDETAAGESVEDDSDAGWAFAADDEVLSKPAGVGAFPAGPTNGGARHEALNCSKYKA